MKVSHLMFMGLANWSSLFLLLIYKLSHSYVCQLRSSSSDSLVYLLSSTVLSKLHHSLLTSLELGAIWKEELHFLCQKRWLRRKGERVYVCIGSSESGRTVIDSGLSGSVSSGLFWSFWTSMRAYARRCVSEHIISIGYGSINYISFMPANIISYWTLRPSPDLPRLI